MMKPYFETKNGVLYHADCMDVMEGMECNSVDLVLTDPPYGMEYQSSWRIEKYDKITGDDSTDFVGGFVDGCFRVMKDDTHIYSFCSWHKVDVFKYEIDRMFNTKNILVWVKNNHGSGDLTGSYGPKHEFCIFAHKGRRDLIGERTTDIIKCRRTNGTDSIHPTQKPLELIKMLITKSSIDGEVVMDPFLGSGTTAVACEQLNRKWIGIEREEQYCEIAAKRLLEPMQKSLLTI